MKLYYKAGACSLAPHIALCEAGLPFEIEAVDLVTKVTASGADFKAINPKGYIPALVRDDGEILTEGVAISLYIASLVPHKSLAPAADYFRVVEWLVFTSTELHKTSGMIFRPTTPEDFKPVLRDLLKSRYDLVEAKLTAAAAGPYLLGEDFTVADAYLFTVVNWAPRLGLDTAAWPALTAYMGRVRQRPAVQAAMTAEGLL